MNTKKKTILGAAFVVSIIALAGVGYAAITNNFQGTTSSANQTVDVDWVKVSLTDVNQYTARTVPYTEKAFYWDSATNSSGTTWTPKTANVQMTYALTIDLTSVENNDKLQLQISGLTAADANFTLSATFGGEPLDISGGGVATVGGADGTVKSSFPTGDLVVILTPVAVATDGVPPTTAVFPALTFTLVGENLAVPA